MAKEKNTSINKPTTPNSGFRPNPGGGGPNKGRNPNQKGGKGPLREDEFRINDNIRVPEVRLTGDNLAELSEKLGETLEPNIYPTAKLRKMAESLELDLIELNANAVPPVVRIMDYNKFLYQRKKREKEMKSNAAKTVIKEIRFGPHTDDHDLEFKTKHAMEFLKEGSKVKAYVHYKGRSIVFKEPGELLLLNFIKALEDVGAPEALPKLEGRKMIVMISPKKIGGKK